jgi:hypothetical protein
MKDDQRDQENVPESLADEHTQQELAKARRQTRAKLVRMLKVSKETVRRIEKRSDLYISTLRGYVEGAGGKLTMVAEFPDKPPVILAALGTDDRSKKTKKKAGNNAKSKAKTSPAA